MYNKRNTLEERIHIVRKILSLVVAVAGLSFGAPTITIIPSIGPVSSSPNYSTYIQNAMQALQSDPTLPVGVGAGLYSRATTPINPSHIIDTTNYFTSWLGLANPTGAFSGEFGNALYFGLRVVGANGADTFTLNDLIINDSLFITPTVQLRYDTATDTYDGNFVLGVNYGGDGALGGSDDSFVTGGASRFTPVNALFCNCYYLNYEFDPASPGATDAARLAAFAGSLSNYIGGLPSQGFTGEIKGLASGSFETVFTNSIPEPSTYALMGLGLVVLAFVRHRAA